MSPQILEFTGLIKVFKADASGPGCTQIKLYNEHSSLSFMPAIMNKCLTSAGSREENNGIKNIQQRMEGGRHGEEPREEGRKVIRIK